ncbi:MAG: SpoIIE family protein phosphatase [Deltaproteobacteria bacterium]|nr:SpoIIE family protein phosphatase [Deltaproteobacteria bacterium]
MNENKNLTILLVDDEPIGIKVLERTLKKEGYHVITAYDGPTARTIASKNQPDLILLDIIMPGEDGFEVIRQLKEDPRTVHIPVIFLTGKDGVDSKITGFDLGAVDYITKPFHGQEVLARVRLHLQLSLATNTLISSQADRLRQIKDAQESMLVSPEDIPGANFGVCYQSLLEAGGDFYDVLQISDDIYGYFVADISGHDIATSYMTSAVKALLKQNCIPIYQPAESMRMINHVLEEILQEGKYLTACYARLNRKSETMSLINCGHPPAVYIPKNGDVELIKLMGDVLGAFHDVFFEVKDIHVRRGDRFFLYSDGLIERPGDKNVWTKGLEDLSNACRDLRDMPVVDAVACLRDVMHQKTKVFEDDIVVLGIEV